MEKSKHTRENTIVLFDVDGTLTAPRKVSSLARCMRSVVVGCLFRGGG